MSGSPQASPVAKAGAAAFLVIAVLVAFWPVLTNDFVSIDDGQYVTRNPHVKAGLTVDGIDWAWTTGYAANWHPLTWMSHMLDAQLFGMRPWGHHLSSLLLHLASTVLLFLALERMTGAFWPSVTTSALFGLHPLHVESVAWVAERKDVLSALFWMLAMVAYARYVEAPSRGRYACVFLAVALGLSAKPMLVTLPIVFLLLDFWPLGRFKNEKPARLLYEKLPLVPLVLASSVVTLLVQARGGAVSRFADFSPWERLQNALVAYASYIGKAFWPVDLSFFYPHPGAPSLWKTTVSIVFLALTTLLAVRERRHRPYLLVGWLWYLGTLVPVSGLVQVGVQSMADRYTYLPLVGIFVMASWGAAEVLRPKRKRWTAIVSALVLVPMIVLTQRQVLVWRSSTSLYEHALRVTGNNALVAFFLARTFDLEGRDGDAIVWYERVVRASPDYAEARKRLGVVLARANRPRDAVTQLEEALRIQPRDVEVMTALASALMRIGETGRALDVYRQALRLDPAHAEAHSLLGLALAQRGDLVGALEHLTRAVEIAPRFAQARQNLAMTRYLRGEYAEAWEQVHVARRLGLSPQPSLLQLLLEKMPEPRSGSE